MERPGNLEIFARIALIVSERSTCKKYKVGCIIVDEEANNILSIGYNGTPSGYPHCNRDEEQLHKMGSLEIHAEVNALAKVKNPEKHELTIYVTHKPCLNCAKTILAFKNILNIKTIVYMFNFRDRIAIEEKISITDFLSQNGISLYTLDDDLLNLINKKNKEDKIYAYKTI